MTQTDSSNTTRKQYSAKHEEQHLRGEELASKVKELVHEGNVRRIIVKQEKRTILDIPVTVGVVGTLLAPWLVPIGVLGVLLTKCTIEVVRTESSDEPLAV